MDSNYYLQNDGKACEIVNLFIYISKIPRGSSNEEKISRFMADWAKDNGFYHEVDSVGNVMIDVPATEGFENVPMVILQGHMDMVHVRDNGVNIDFRNDPIPVVVDNERIYANGTTLGADDGLGMAVIQYCFTATDYTHGPLRGIFTVNEENGFTGVMNLSEKWVRNGAYLINVDSEENNTVTVSSAGSDKIHISGKMISEAVSCGKAFKVTLEMLNGGHSGMEINKGRANAVKCIGDFLARLQTADVDVKIEAFNGGLAANAIPASSFAVFITDNNNEQKVKCIFDEAVKTFENAYGDIEKNGRFILEDAEMPRCVFSRDDSNRIISFVSVLQNGVLGMSQVYPELVECSSNLGVISAGCGEFHTDIMTRSSNMGKQEYMRNNIISLSRIFGFDFKLNESGAGWQSKQGCRLIREWEKSCIEKTGKRCDEVNIHAGLECGEFNRLNPDAEIISVGITVNGAHSTEESVMLSDITPFVDTLISTLTSLSGNA